MNTLTTEEPVETGVAAESHSYLSPSVNILETKEGYLLEAELPGVNKSGLEVLLEGNELTIIGRRQADTVKAEVVYRESSAHDYRRSFALDPSIDAAIGNDNYSSVVATIIIPDFSDA